MWWPHVARRTGNAFGPLILGVGHAASGVGPFRELARLQSHWDVRALCLPGRERRLGEPPVADVEELLRRLLPVTEQLLAGRRYALVGVCSGAVLATVLASVLEPRGAPVGVVVLSSVAPQHRARPRDHDKRDIASRLVVSGSTPREVAEDDEFGPLLRAAYRADLALAARREVRLTRPVPFLVLIGEEDDFQPTDMVSWRAVTTGPVEIRTVPGTGHFALPASVEQIIAWLDTLL